MLCPGIENTFATVNCLVIYSFSPSNAFYPVMQHASREVLGLIFLGLEESSPI